MTQCQAPVNHYLSLCLVARCGPLWQRFALLHAIHLHCFRACEFTVPAHGPSATVRCSFLGPFLAVALLSALHGARTRRVPAHGARTRCAHLVALRAVCTLQRRCILRCKVPARHMRAPAAPCPAATCGFRACPATGHVHPGRPPSHRPASGASSSAWSVCCMARAGTAVAGSLYSNMVSPGPYVGPSLQSGPIFQREPNSTIDGIVGFLAEHPKPPQL